MNKRRTRNNKRLSINDFDIGLKLNSGKFARVYLAKKKNTNFLVALKVTTKRGILATNMSQYLQSEAQMLTNCRHPNIVRLYDWFDDKTNVTLILEYCAGGELWEILNKRGRFEENVVSKYILQLSSALKYIHSKNMIHRDIKPENLLLDASDNLKLCDFGWSVHLKQAKERRETFCGTLDYIAPEILNKERHDKYVDIWAVGVLTYELIVGSAPFDHDTSDICDRSSYDIKKCKMHNIQALKFKFPTTAISKAAIDFIQSFLTLDPIKRIELEQIPKHEFIANHIDYLQQFQFFDIDLPQKRTTTKRRRMRRNKKNKLIGSDFKRQKLNKTDDKKREYIVIDSD